LFDCSRLHPGLPESHIDFLREIGSGQLNACSFAVYDGFVEPPISRLEGILLCGDNFAGWSIGYDTRDQWRLVGLDSETWEALPEGSADLASFFSQWVAKVAE